MDEKNLKNSFKEGEKKLKIQKLEHHPSLTGKLDLELNEDINNYLNKANDFWGYTEVAYKK